MAKRNVRITALVGDKALRETIKSSLLSAGFTNAMATVNFRAARTSILEGHADLVILDIDRAGDRGLDLMRAIRHHEIGDNPFPVVVCLTARADLLSVIGLIDAGFDDVLLAPLDMAVLMTRIRNLMDARRPFAVTADYIGPDRRDDKPENRGRLQTLPLLSVPNPLALMARGAATAAELRARIEDGIAKIDELRVRRDAEQVGRLVGATYSKYLFDERDDDWRGLLNGLDATLADLKRRLPGTDYFHTLPTCVQMKNTVGRLLADLEKPAFADTRQLSDLSHALERLFRADFTDRGTASAGPETPLPSAA